VSKISLMLRHHQIVTHIVIILITYYILFSVDDGNQIHPTEDLVEHTGNVFRPLKI
jgi:hypothetical protein